MVKSVIAIIGPTAIGKTTWAISLAKHFKTEIISTDSRQFFKEMRIGTAVPNESELNSVKHHFIQHLSIFDHYSVGDFEKDVALKLDSLFKKKDTIILVGGSGLYMDAILYGLDTFPKVRPEIRQELNQEYQRAGLEPLRFRLQELDPVYFEQVDGNNPHRIIRALEVCLTSGTPYSDFLGKKRPKVKMRHLLIGLDAPREVIYERINLRVDVMIEQGLVAEAQKLFQHRQLNGLNTVGYKELFLHFEGKLSLDEAVNEIKKNTRRFAKRQLTWYRKNKEVQWLPYDLNEHELIFKVGTQLNYGA